MKQEDIISILVAARPYISFNGVALLDLATKDDVLAQATALAASAKLHIAEALIAVSLGSTETGVIINPTWLKRTVTDIRHDTSGSGNRTWYCTLDDGRTLYIRQSNKQCWLDAGYTALEQMNLGDEWQAYIVVYLTEGDKGFLDTQHVVSGGTLIAPAVDPGKVRRDEVIQQAANWVYGVQTHYFLDTETSGKGDDDEIIEIAIVDDSGNVLLNSRVRPSSQVSIHPEAYTIHGISLEDLKNAPAITSLTIQDEPLLDWLIDHEDVIVTYGADFDARLLFQSFKTSHQTFQCAMKAYAKFNGVKHPKTGDWQYVKLSEACKQMDVDHKPDHSAINDVQATRELVKALALYNDNNPF